MPNCLKNITQIKFSWFLLENLGKTPENSLKIWKIAWKTALHHFFFGVYSFNLKLYSLTWSGKSLKRVFGFVFFLQNFEVFNLTTSFSKNNQISNKQLEIDWNFHQSFALSTNAVDLVFRSILLLRRENSEREIENFSHFRDWKLIEELLISLCNLLQSYSLRCALSPQTILSTPSCPLDPDSKGELEGKNLNFWEQTYFLLEKLIFIC